MNSSKPDLSRCLAAFMMAKFEMKTLPEIVRNDKNSIKRGPFGGALKKDDFVDEGYLVYEQRHAIHNVLIMTNTILHKKNMRI